jgi:hypothetical protein
MSGQLSNNSETNCLKLISQNVAWANVGTVAGLQPSSSAGTFNIELHTASPGAGGTASTNEASYGGYARQTVARSSGGWTVTGTSPATSENAAAITFPQSSTSQTVTDASESLASGASDMTWLGPLVASLAIANLVTPQFAINAFQKTLL